MASYSIIMSKTDVDRNKNLCYDTFDDHQRNPFIINQTLSYYLLISYSISFVRSSVFPQHTCN